MCLGIRGTGSNPGQMIINAAEYHFHESTYSAGTFTPIRSSIIVGESNGVVRGVGEELQLSPRPHQVSLASTWSSLMKLTAGFVAWPCLTCRLTEPMGRTV